MATKTKSKAMAVAEQAPVPSRRTKTVYMLDFSEDGWCPELAMSYFAAKRVTTCDAAVAHYLRKYASQCMEKEVEA